MKFEFTVNVTNKLQLKICKFTDNELALLFDLDQHSVLNGPNHDVSAVR